MRALRGTVASSVLLVASTAAAGPDAEAQRLFDQARALAEKGRWTEACPRLAESLRLEPNMTTEFRLADCYERTGRTASAWQHYVAAARAAAQNGETAKEHFASERAAKLEPNVDKLMIVPPADVTDLQIERDGRIIPSDQWNTALPLDPGEHTVHVWAPGKTSYDVIITTSGTGEVRRIVVPTLEAAIPWRLSEQAKPTPEPQTYAPPPPAQQPHQVSGWRPVGWALTGVGVLSLGVGGGLYIGGLARTDPCSGSSCVPGVTLIAAGAVVTVVGVLVLLATSP